MDCGRARELNLDGLRGRLSAATKAELQEHLATCARCRAHAEAERVLGEVLDSLPQHAAPLLLKRRLAESWPVLTTGTARPRRIWAPRWAATIATAAAALAIVVAGSTSLFVEQRAALRQLESESVNDHLRVLEGAPLARVTGGLHEVKPWFGGKLDFAPDVRFAGSDDFPLEGGAVEPFLDRRAAVLVYKRRLHTASLFVLPREGLAFPPDLRTQTVRGFHVALWQDEEQGYALVSDLDLKELLELQAQIAAR
ncbi:MAG TPA: zf-HC2 domain-containing protein [Myxococcota bacterium]|nr:zf-HC2 domain-containing protein [Myxococcota bacterium]